MKIAMPSFDIVSKIELPEVENAVQAVKKEIAQRYDFKGSVATIDRSDDSITIIAADDYKLDAIHDMLKAHITRRKLDVKVLDFEKPQKASGNTLRQIVKIKQGIDSETAKKIVKEIKLGKFKVQASIRGEEVRIDGKKRDDLQEAIAFVKTIKLELPLQFINFRD
jgi:uncharacterized protein YajQ (UPF0234 family)